MSADIVRKYPNVKLTINTDAHHTNHLDFMNYGVATAQKGFVTKDRVINALSRKLLKTLLKII
ncbi:DNA polymerase X family [Staphylococcus aureus]|nr:DNA polymerase X family [Staphylococcus aureus]